MVNFLGRFFRTGGKVSFVKIGGQALVLVALVLGLVAFVGNNKTITVNVDGQASSVQTFGGSVSQVLKKANVDLKPADRVTPALAATVDNGTVINVNTSKEIKVNLNGAKSTVQTTSRQGAGSGEPAWPGRQRGHLRTEGHAAGQLRCHQHQHAEIRDDPGRRQEPSTSTTTAATVGRSARLVRDFGRALRTCFPSRPTPRWSTTW